MSDYYILGIYLSFLLFGLAAPFVFTLGYVWVDIACPQFLSRFLEDQPVSLVMGTAALIAYAAADRRDPPRLTLSTMLIVLMAVWVTFTTSTLAVAPVFAWDKWSWAFKTVLFAAAIPYIIRSRAQIEAFLQVFVFAAAMTIWPFGLKTILGGGGYGQQLAVVNSGAVVLSESSTLAAVCAMLVPILLWLRTHSLLLTDKRLRNAIYGGYCVLCVMAAVGSFARTAIVAFGVLAIAMWTQSRRKVLFMTIAVVSGLAVFSITSTAWRDRIATIEAPEKEGSALSRILVWEWTLNFVETHPLGGGFSAYVINNIESSSGMDFGQKAFHSIYFEVLGEQGWPGLAIFLTLLTLTLNSFRRVMRRTRGDRDLAWCNDLARAFLVGQLVLMSGGAFIGIAFKPMLWYLFALATSLEQYVLRVEQAEPQRPRTRLTPRPVRLGGALAGRQTAR